jgi:hypothetical protein
MFVMWDLGRLGMGYGVCVCRGVGRFETWVTDGVLNLNRRVWKREKGPADGLEWSPKAAGWPVPGFFRRKTVVSTQSVTVGSPKIYCLLLSLLLPWDAAYLIRSTIP